jgi:hypothetical protein
MNQIGFNQRVRLEWLEQTATLVLAGNTRQGVNDALQEILKDRVSVGGQAVRGNREKIITILLKIWLRPPPELEPLRKDGLELIKTLPKLYQPAIHWGMTLAVYPFWAGVATQVGRLLKLQGTAAAAQVQRRVREQYGERETVSRATRRVLRSFYDWDILRETGSKGVYKVSPPVIVNDKYLIAWLVEAFLQSRANGACALKDLFESPSFFPFQIEHVHAQNLVKVSPRLDVFRHGFDEDLVMLGKERK